nr:MarC family protein [Thioalkalivibrio sp.]
MIDVAIVAFTTFFVTVGPVDVAVVYAALTPRHTPAARKKMALRATVVATIILLAFALLGETLLSWLGISLPALRTAGGILLLLIGIDMVFARQSGGVSATESETREASDRADLSVFPLATPLIAGPGAMGAAILLMAGTSGDALHQATVIAMLLLVLLLTLACLLAAVRIQHLLGITGAQVLTRILGVLLCALAVQFVFDGIADSGILV